MMGTSVIFTAAEFALRTIKVSVSCVVEHDIMFVFTTVGTVHNTAYSPHMWDNTNTPVTIFGRSG
jgi:hypothetical protein